jgi:uncharacterized membrane protein YdbT with pleckstrin-like domain
MDAERKDDSVTAGDELVWKGNPSLWAKPFSLAFAVLLSLVLVGLPWLITLFVKSRTTRYRITRKRVSVTTGLFNIEQRELLREHVRSVNFRKNIVGLGEVEIASSASDSDAVLLLADIWNPDRVAALIRAE